MKNILTKNKEVKANIIGELYSKRKNCLWYGGSLADIKYKDMTLRIVANGDVRGDIYENGEFLTSFKDKKNQGNFAHVIDSYVPDIDSDEKLLKCISDDLDETKEGISICLDNNNWYEVFVFDEDMSFIDSYIIESTDDIDEAINETVDKVEEVYNTYMTV